MADIATYKIQFKSDFVLTIHGDAGWTTPFCIKFWTGAPSQAYFVGWDGTEYINCKVDETDASKLIVLFDDHQLPVGQLKMQMAWHTTIADFPKARFDEVMNQMDVVATVEGEDKHVELAFDGEADPEVEYFLPAYANEAQRIANEEQRIAAEAIRIANEESRIAAETIRQQNEAQRISNEESRVEEFARLKQESETATADANAAATLANEKAQLAADKAALAGAAATLANEKAALAADKAALADAAATLANDKAALAQQKAEYAQTQGDYAKTQGDYAKAQGDYAKEQGEIVEEDHDRAEADHTRAESDHTTAGNDHTQAGTDHLTAVNDHAQSVTDHNQSVTDHNQADTDHTRAESDHAQATSDHTQAGTDHTRAESDHATASADHTQAGQDHTRAESDHTRAESDHAAVEVYVDSLGAFDISAYHATGGVLAKYADLAAAIGTNGANIPDALRKGGMSVKFVLSSDNKYVQYRYMSSSTADADFTNVTQWQGVDDKPTFGSKNLVKSEGIYKREAIASGIDTDVASVIPLLHSDITDPYVTHDTDCCYSSANMAPVYSSVSVDVAINNNSGDVLKTGVKYHQFVKVRVVTDNPLTYKIQFAATNVSSDIVYNDKTYNTGEFYTVYVGSFLGKAGAVNNYKIFKPTSFDGATKARAQNIKAEYYGGYIIEDSVLTGVLDFDGLATLLDYTQNICHVQMDGRAVIGYNNANLALQKIGDLSSIDVEDNSNASAAIEGVNRKVPVTNKFVSTIPLLPTDVTNMSAEGSIGEDGEYYYEIVVQPVYSSLAVSTPSYIRLESDKKFHVFAKIRLDLEDDCVFNPSFNVSPSGIKDLNVVEQTIPGGQTACVYIGSCVGTYSYGTLSIKYGSIKTPTGGAIVRSQNVKVSFYGAYVIPDEDLNGINNLSALAQCLTYGKLETVVSEFSISAGQSYYAELSRNSDHAANSDMATEATKIRNPYYQKFAGFYGDSLVTYTSTIIPRIFSHLGLNAGGVGVGGGQVNNIFSKQGFCTIERMALLPKNMKVLCFWGGANDGNYYVDRTQPDWIDHTKFGTINDQPLGVADMFNYRVTIANIDQKNTPGRTQTFYQAYKTLLRNFSILFPHTLVVCVSQYKSFYYNWITTGRDGVILKKDYPQKIAAEKECCEEYSIPFCDLYTKAGVNLSNCFSLLYDDGGSLIHPIEQLGEKAITLIAQTVQENMFLQTPTDAWTYDFVKYDGAYADKDVRELKEYLVDLRSEDEYNAMTLSEAIQGFIDYTTEHSITLKNNMYLVFYVSQYGTSAGYFLINKDNPTSTDSWEQWTDETVYDMRYRDETLNIDYGVQTLSEAITSFMHKAEVEGWTYSNLMYMYFLTDDNGSWSMYRLTTPATPSSTSSWTFVKSGQANT